MSRKLFLRAHVGLIALSVAVPAYAQDAADTANMSADDGAIVVTAQRRAQNVQDVPLAVTALGGDSLEKKGARDITALGELAPSLSITNNGGTPQIFMRGIGSTNTNAVGDSAVAVHVDGVYLARANALSAQFYDLSRVEVVRGPQGTLYGRNATAGAINVITNQPRFEFEGAASVEYGNYDTLVTSGMVNLPVTDTLAIRGAFQTIRHDGYLRTIDGPSTARGNDRNDQDDVSGRLQILFKPTDSFKLTLRGDYTHQGGAGGATNAYNPAESFEPYKSRAELDVYRNNKIYGASAEAQYDFDFATLTYLGGFHQVKLDLLGENLMLGNHRPSYVNNNQKSWSHELRLAGSTGPVEWVVGGFLFREHNKTDARIGINGGLFLTFLQNPEKSRSKALFGQATYSITDALRLTGGLRYTEDRKSIDGGSYIFTADGLQISQFGTNIADVTWKSTDWKAGVEYDVGPRSLVYAQVATAYKAGGYFDGLPPNSYDPEEIIAYEIGSKNVFGNLLLNLSAFYNDYTGMQVSAVEMIAGESALVTRNAGSASVYGVEVEANYKVVPNGTITFSGAWLRARYDDFLLAQGDPFVNNGNNANVARCYTADYSIAGNQQRVGDFSGCRMARTPTWSFNAGYTHRFDLANGGTVDAQLQSHYESGKNLEFHGFDTNYQKAFTKTDFTLTYNNPDNNWSIQAYVRNIENKAVMTMSTSDAREGDPLKGTRDYAPPRLYGVRFSATF